jgi:hypothetical protein
MRPRLVEHHKPDRYSGREVEIVLRRVVLKLRFTGLGSVQVVTVSSVQAIAMNPLTPTVTKIKVMSK